MERGEWDNEADYPRAPLPAHERTWRHPSEHGATTWVESEPPLVVGRGLSMATGTVGVLLAVGLLWLMVPHNNRGGVAAESSTTLRSTNADQLVARSDAPVAIAGSTVTTAVVATTVLAASSSSVIQPESSLGAVATVPTPSAPVEHATAAAPMAMAVALLPGHFVVTTANAVGSNSSVTLQLPSGTTVVGTVVSVDSAAGIAVLSIPADADPAPIQASTVAIPTDGAVVLAPAPTAASVWRDENGLQITFDEETPVSEGALVLDTDSHLIGMCTMAASGMRVLDASTLLQAIQAAIAHESAAWIGLTVATADNGDLTVTDVSAQGPAATAGLQVGDVIRAVDGDPVASMDVLRRAVQAHHPGDTMTVTILRVGTIDPLDLQIAAVAGPGSL